MKIHLLKLAVLFGVLALGTSTQAALLIDPGDAFLFGNQTGQSFITAAINAAVEPDPVELYKQNEGEAFDTGSLASSYVTAFNGDLSGGTITWVGPGVVGPTAYLLVKDGAQSESPPYAWYLFNLTTLGWDGMETLSLSGFWPDGGAISHVTLYGRTPVPEAGALLMFGTGLIGLVGYRRVRRMQ